MEDRQLFKRLNLPKSTQVGRNFPFQALEKQLSVKERKEFQAIIESRGMRLLATFNPQSTNITKYEDEKSRYEEIHLFQLKMKRLKESDAKKIYTMLAHAMPYPLIIRFVYEGKVIWALAEHTINEKTEGLKLEKLFLTDPDIPEEVYLKDWHFNRLNNYSLMHFYKDFIEKLAEVQLQKKHEVTDAREAIGLYEQLEQLDKEIEQFVKKAQREKQLKKRIEWQMKATKLKQEKEQLIKGAETHD